MLNKVIVAFIVNAFIETLLKYTILIILNDDLIVDPRSFFVLSVAIGAGFSVLRVVYLLITDPDTSLSMALYYCFGKAFTFQIDDRGYLRRSHTVLNHNVA